MKKPDFFTDEMADYLERCRVNCRVHVRHIAPAMKIAFGMQSLPEAQEAIDYWLVDNDYERVGDVIYLRPRDS